MLVNQNKKTMKNNNLKPGLIFIVTVILFGAFMRLIPHWPNLTPVAAMALFGGTWLSRKYLAFVIPFAALFMSDLILGFHNSMWAVYLAFGITVTMGFYLRKKVTAGNVIMAALGSSILFFLITNFAAWLGNPLYPQTMTGLMGSYVAGLAFFNDGNYGISFFLNEVTGTLFYSGLFFGVYALAKKKFPILALA